MKLVFSRAFESDLASIKNYVSTILKNGDASKKVVRTILDGVFALKDNPYLGISLEAFFNVGEIGFRRLCVGKYLVFYRLDGGSVVIERVFHGSRNYLSLLFLEE